MGWNVGWNIGWNVGNEHCVKFKSEKRREKKVSLRSFGFDLGFGNWVEFCARSFFVSFRITLSTLAVLIESYIPTALFYLVYFNGFLILDLPSQ